MSCIKYLLVLIISCCLVSAASAQAAFRIVPLGVKGGSDESNLSAYAVAAKGNDNYVCLDAGTLNYGLQKAITAGLFYGDAATVLKNNIKGYLISHPHLDHLAGLVMNSPDDGPKPIYALPFCLNAFREKYFTWQTWANFANEGEKPQLGKYRYVSLAEGEEILLEQTGLRVRAFPLSHSGANLSTAFLVRSNDNYMLYLGDTGPDAVEKSTALQQLWQEVASLVKNKKLKAIFIEVSFANEQPDQQLFGHLTPRHLITELNNLGKLAGPEALKNFPVVITHIKPAPGREATIFKQLQALNNLQINFIEPRQGTLLEF
jgi:cAMP phosphodiesterase